MYGIFQPVLLPHLFDILSGHVLKLVRRGGSAERRDATNSVSSRLYGGAENFLAALRSCPLPGGDLGRGCLRPLSARYRQKRKC